MKFYITFCRAAGILRIALIFNDLQYAVFWLAICGLSACNMWSFAMRYVAFCISVCRQACADEFIERMPDKYNTWIEQGGSNVSGGQRQRLCIARALLKHPKVLILDDSTSAVDTATDAKIKKAFATKIPGTTKIIVSQRISSIQDADRILVLENGCVSGFDTHENLVENNKVYREIYEVQTQGGGDFDEAGE